MYRYEDCGLSNIFLKDGYTEEETPWGLAISVDDVEGLHLAIGMELVNSHDPLNGQEFRFLRKELGLSQKRFATMFGYSDQMVAKWEKGQSDLPRTIDILIRMMYEENHSETSKLSEILEAINELDRQDFESENIQLCKKNGEWVCEAA